jgi:Tfp pilus assembly protein PilF
VSLLIDALKQAEAARRENAQPAEEATSSAGADLRLEPIETAKNPSPSGATEADAKRTAHERDAAMRAAAHDMFRAKSAPPRSMTILVLLSAVVLLACAGGAYVWWASQPHGGLEPGPALAASSRIEKPLAQSSPLAAVAITQTADSASTPLPADAPSPPPAPQSPAMAKTAPEEPRQAAFTVSSRGRRVQMPASPAEEEVPALQVRRGSARAAQSPEDAPIARAYAAYQAEDYVQARALYQNVLRTDSHNADALLALGLIAQHDGQNDIAARYLREALTVDPKNATAQSQLALLQADADPVSAESRLRTLLAGQPDSASGQFALGSILARQGRWNEAQQAFFQAYTLDSENPDILYNLAVSLDQLRQPALAREYYERANQAAQRRPASFDPIRAMQRATALSATSAAPAANR